MRIRWNLQLADDCINDCLILANSSLVMPVVWCFIALFLAALIFHGILDELPSPSNGKKGSSAPVENSLNATSGFLLICSSVTLLESTWFTVAFRLACNVAINGIKLGSLLLIDCINLLSTESTSPTNSADNSAWEGSALIADWIPDMKASAVRSLASSPQDSDPESMTWFWTLCLLPALTLSFVEAGVLLLLDLDPLRSFRFSS